jgi:hypothetical protein
MNNIERREIINLLKEVYQFHIGSWSEKAEQDFMDKLRDKIDQMEDENKADNLARCPWEIVGFTESTPIELDRVKENKSDETNKE